MLIRMAIRGPVMLVFSMIVSLNPNPYYEIATSLRSSQ